jgi:hypothetical protein
MLIATFRSIHHLFSSIICGIIGLGCPLILFLSPGEWENREANRTISKLLAKETELRQIL